MTVNSFHSQVNARWAGAVSSLKLSSRTHRTWTNVEEMPAVLRPFMGKGLAHAHFPTGGGHHFIEVECAPEAGCLAFKSGAREYYYVKPKVLTIEHFPATPHETFFHLELDNLKPSGVYEPTRTAGDLVEGREEVAEVAPGHYAPDRVYYEPDLRCDDAGTTCSQARVRSVVRFLRGTILIVAETSSWNAPRNYLGLHNGLTPHEIRAVIRERIMLGRMPRRRRRFP